MTEKKKTRFAWTLWGPVILAFIAVTLAWIALIQIAKENPTERVPLVEPLDPK